MSDGLTLADRLNKLFATVHPADRGPYTVDEVAQATQISASYLRYLRSGERTNPTRERLQVLARFFGVDVGYFFDDDVAARVASQLDLLATVRDSPVRDIAQRMVGLSPQSLDTVRQLIENVRRLEGLPPGD